MTLLSNWDDNSMPVHSGISYNDIWGYAAGGREYAIIGTSHGTQFIDVTIPTNPTLITFQAGGSSASVWRDFKTYGNHLYAVSDQGSGSSLQIFDLSGLPVSVTKVYDSPAFFSTAHNIFIDEGSGRMYVFGANNNSTGIHIIDLATNPASPSLLASFNLGAYVHDGYSRNDTLFAFMGNQGWGIFDLSNLANPQLLNLIYSGTYPESGYAHSGWATPDLNYIFWCDETHNTGIHSADISNPSALTFQPTFRSNLLAPTYSNSVPHNAYVKGNTLYVSYYHDGLQVWDISDPTAPVRSGYFDTDPDNVDYANYRGAWGAYPFLPSGVILVSDVQFGLFVLQENTLFPVTLADFAAEDQDDQVRLRWNTYSETNNSHFLVERSSDGILFEAIAQVEGAGNHIGELYYETFDREPLQGMSHYRLRQVDRDGEFSFSEAVTLNRSSDFSLVKVYPSPSAGGQQVKLQLALDKPQNVQVLVRNMVGQNVHRSDHDLVSGTQTLQLPSGKWSDGVYHVQVKGSNTLAEQKLIVSR